MFAASTPYFGPSAEENPLLHTWSVGVEEQFYLLYPLAVQTLWRRVGRRGVALACAGVAIASLAAAEIGSRRAPTMTFFLAPTRAWSASSTAV